MPLVRRIVLFVVLTAVLPVVMIAWAATSASSGWLRNQVSSAQVEAVRTLAGATARQLDDLERVLALHFANFRLETASAEARTAFLVTTYRLFPEITIATLRGTDGRELVPPVYQRADEPEWVAGHARLAPGRIDRFRQEAPTAGGAGTVSWGRPYRPADARTAVVPLVVTSPWGDGLVLGVEVELGQVAARLAENAGHDRELALLGVDGTLLQRVGTAGLVETTAVQSLLNAPAADVAYETIAGVDVLAALAQVPGHPLVVVLAEPGSVSQAASADITARTWYIGGTALVVAIVVAVMLGRSIVRPVQRLADAAEAVERGQLGRTVAIEGQDELAELGRRFDAMSLALARNRREIEAKNAEIEAFNRELQARVEQATAELREAQARLLQSGQLAAVGELSSGLAHELNNPLAGVLGFLQLAQAREPEGPLVPLLAGAETQAQRLKEIVGALQRLTGGSGTGQRVPVDVDALLAEVLGWSRQAFEARRLRADHARAEAPLWVRADPDALGRALGQLVGSIRTVAAPGATLAVVAAREGREVRVDLDLSATVSVQDDWRAAGFGFWVARRVLEEHDATLEEPVTGGRWRIRMPFVARGPS